MHGYLIARFDMTDPAKAPEAYKQYVATATPAYAEHHARFLVRGGKAFPMEGAARTRNVVIQYPTMAEALACYRSETYQKARAYRLPVAEGEIVLAEGVATEGTEQGSLGGEQPSQAGKGYWIARYDVRDMDAYRRYVSMGASAFERFEANFLVRGGAYEAVEGEARARNVVIAFPSVQHAIDCYNSYDYQEARRQRLPVSTGEIIIVEGA